MVKHFASVIQDQVEKGGKNNPSSENSLSPGLQKLALYEEQLSPELLKEAIELMMGAVQQQPTRPESWVALGYASLVAGDVKLAVDYFLQAKQLDPAHADAAVFLEFINENRQTFQAIAESQDLELELAGLQKISNQAQLATKLNQILEQEIQWVMGQIPAEPAADAEALALLQAHFKTARTHFALIENQLLILGVSEEELNIGEKMRLLEQALARFSKLVIFSEGFMALQADLNAGLQQVSQGIKALRTEALSQADGQALHAKLMDQCDQIADQLDTFEQGGQLHHELEQSYHQLIATVEQLGDELESAF